MLRARTKERAAYTLMELMIVIALILAITAISMPVIGTMLDDARLEGATDMVRAKTAEARAYAMEEGKPWRVAYIPGTGVIQVAPEDSADWEQMEQSIIAKPGLFRDQLPKNVYLGTSAGDITSASETPTPGGAWQTIAVYSYDGSAREDSITYFGKYGTPPTAMELRALTGSVTILSANEVMTKQP